VGRTKWHSDRCYERAKKRKQSGSPKAALDGVTSPLNKAVLAKEAAADGRGSMRGGPEYDRFVADGGPALLDQGWTHELIADHYEVSRVTVTHWLAKYRHELAVARERQQWKMGPEAQRALNDFKFFRARYFKIGRGLYKGRPPATTSFHMRWIKAILHAIEVGGQLMILSPPRHGKSLLMTHFVIWQIVRNPDIAIIWVAGSENVAKRFGSTVKDELANNKLLIADFLGPGGSFEPTARSGKQWRDDEFEVATRTIPQPAPTFKAIGRGGTLLSMDADLIVTDDIEDHKRTLQPAVREATKDWFESDLDSRKEDHTAWVYIGSRQHPQDLASHLLENEEWEAIVETAHSWECTLPERDVAAHVDCVLWPEVRDYAFLMKKKRSAGIVKYEMQYLNRPRSTGLTYFERPNLEACRNPQRRLGQRPAGVAIKPIAGLDPGGGSGFQSAIMWGVSIEPPKLYLLELENEQAGSTPHLRSILERWGGPPWHCKDWVIEDNIIDDVLTHDEQVRKIKADLGLTFHPHHTSGANKWDEHLGVTAMIPLYEHNEVHGRRVDLPYSPDGDTQQRVDTYITQHVNFEGVPASRSKWAKDDVVMAAWMPFATIKLWWRKRRRNSDKRNSNTWYPSRTKMTKAPWRSSRKKAA
jgi:hypothetical protein